MSEQLQKTGITLKSLVESPAYANRFKQVLGERAPQFVSSLIQISGNGKLRECDPHSVIAAGMIAAALDLPINPNLGCAYVIPYDGRDGLKASFQMGYKGFVQLANRSGMYRRLNVANVHEGELLKYDRVKADVVIDESQRKSEKVVGYVAYFELSNGCEHAEYWTLDMVEKHAARFSFAFRQKKKDSPWFTDFDAMARKTVLKSLLSHWGPLSIQMQQAVTRDMTTQASPDAEIEFPDTPKLTDAAPVDEVPADAKPVTQAREFTPQEKVSEALSSNMVAFDVFQKYIAGEYPTMQAASWGCTNDIKKADAVVLLRAMPNIIKAIKETP